MSARLREATRDAHEALDARMMAAEPFADRFRYVRYLQVQTAFFGRVDGLYGRLAPRFAPLDVTGLSRLSLAEQDCADLGAGSPNFFPADADDDEAVGWLYVAEGSRLGGAHLLKASAALGLGPNFGARHLAPPEEGLGLSWNAFRRALDAMDEGVGDGALRGALAAFASVDRDVDAYFGEVSAAAPRS